MALVRTTLTGPITAGQLTFGVNNTTLAGFPPIGAAPLQYQPMAIDDEVMFLVSVPALNTVLVRMRGSDGTDAVPHDTGSSVVTSATPAQDWPAVRPGSDNLRPPSMQDIVTYGQTAEAISVPTEAMTYAFLAPTSAGAFTIGAPSVGLNGIELTITSQAAFAHTVTTPGVSGSTGLFVTGAAGNPFTVATFPAQAGVSMQLVAQNGSWNVINASISPVTFS